MSARNRISRPRRAALLLERSSDGERVAAIYLDTNNAQAEADARNAKLRLPLLETAKAALMAARTELAEHPYSDEELAALDAAQIANFAADPGVAAQATEIVGKLAGRIGLANDRREHISALESRVKTLSDKSGYLRSSSEAQFFVRAGLVADAELTARFATADRLRLMLLLVVEGRVTGLYRRPGPAFAEAEHRNRAAYEALCTTVRTELEREIAALQAGTRTEPQEAYYQSWRKAVFSSDLAIAAEAAAEMAAAAPEDIPSPSHLARAAAAQARLSTLADYGTWYASGAAPAQVHSISVADMAQSELRGLSPEAERRIEHIREVAQEQKERNHREWMQDRAEAISAIKNMADARKRNDQVAALQYEMIRRDHDARGSMRALNERSIDLTLQMQELREALLDIGDLTDDPDIAAVIRDVIGYTSRSEEQ
jgi:hypothetical protein